MPDHSESEREREPQRAADAIVEMREVFDRFRRLLDRSERQHYDRLWAAASRRQAAIDTLREEEYLWGVLMTMCVAQQREIESLRSQMDTDDTGGDDGW